jgi:hypothetical protein
MSKGLIRIDPVHRKRELNQEEKITHPSKNREGNIQPPILAPAGVESVAERRSSLLMGFSWPAEKLSA